MVEYFAGSGLPAEKTSRWTYRKMFVAIVVTGLFAWAGVLSIVHALLTSA